MLFVVFLWRPGLEGEGAAGLSALITRIHSFVSISAWRKSELSRFLFRERTVLWRHMVLHENARQEPAMGLVVVPLSCDSAVSHMAVEELKQCLSTTVRRVPRAPRCVAIEVTVSSM